MKKSGLALIGVSLWGAGAFAQSPNLVIRADLRPTLITSAANATAVRYYDVLGRPSTVGILLTLEPGYRAVLNERLQRIGSDGDQLDEAYLEDPGSWRVGKQYLPFGARTLIRDSVMAIRLDATIGRGDLKANVAFCDGGPGQPRGAVVRIGSRLGISLAIGKHFAAHGTSLAQVRDPERAPGKHSGYRTLIGLDYGRRLGVLHGEAELVILRQGATSSDSNEEISEVRIAYAPLEANLRLIGAWARRWSKKGDYYRFEAEVPVTGNVLLVPFVRFSGLAWKDFGITARIKL